MSEPQIPEQLANPEDPVVSPEELPADPLLGSDSFIDPDRPEPGMPATENQQQEQTPNVGPGAVIAAEPISILRPGEDSVDTAPLSAAKRRNPEEMSKRPNWLPGDWKIDLRIRSSGASAGLIDRYFIEPSGQRRFRSKNEVLHFLETGSKRKRNSTSEADAAPSESQSSKKKSNKKSEGPASKKKSTKKIKKQPSESPASKKKSSKKIKKTEAVNSDAESSKKIKKSEEAVNSDAAHVSNGDNEDAS